MSKINKKIILYSFLFFLLVAINNGKPRAEESIEFYTDLLDTEDKQHIDLSRFSQADYVMPGRYQLTFRVNGQSISKDTVIPFYSRQVGEKITSEACISPLLLDKVGLTERIQNRISLWHEGQCADFSVLEGVKAFADMPELQFNLIIPQAYLEYTDPYWTPPSRWDNGIPGLLLDYNADATLSKPEHGGHSQSAWINGTVGANYGAWRLRSNYRGNYSYTAGQSRQKSTSLDWDRIYLYRALPAWRSKLTIGESSFSSDLLQSWSYTGLALTSDERQLPPKLREYSPEINGIADTNARVTVSQQGRILYDSTVPAGPFSIKELSSSIRGELDVKVTEQDGQVKTFQVNATYVPFLSRPGQFRYKFFLGRSRYQSHQTEGPIFGAGEISYGVSNYWSVYGGSIIAGKYNAAALGIGLDLMRLGTLSLDATQSMVKTFRDEGTQIGRSWRFNYAKSFDDIGANISFTGYRFSESDYTTMQQYLDERYRNYTYKNNNKETYTLSLSQYFSEQKLSIGGSYHRQTYWDRNDSTNYNLRADKYFSAFGVNNISVGISAARNRYSDTNKVNDEIFLRLSVPLSSGSVSYNGSYNNQQFSHTASYYNQTERNNTYSLTAGVTHSKEGQTDAQLSGYYSHVGGIANTSVNMSATQGRYFSVGGSVYGGVTITPEGAALHSGGFNGGTRLLVDTEGIAKVPIDDGRVITNYKGFGVVTDINSYYRNITTIDVDELTADMEARNAVVESFLTEGAIGYRKFDVVKGKRLFVVLKLQDNGSPPFGASVRNEKGHELGIVSDGGVAWISGIQPKEKLTVNWSKKICTAELPEHIDSLSQVLLPCTEQEQINING
ncbi:hypothetical protein Xmau_00879 [Xenorhabdus mauleonii]|uniref:Outer membrane usher protein PapC n=1 Tax=Xenorhabdus mauleonii TaxID=351675 RepID=A0A1I3RT73_9GAMM|nr:fimbria/pilus outer membrane usher protein [Xenorhabdus mauleonii]PHM46465.1 hypothetical protein Xmau_00879 [Xenorhabdus mauleonii]SFJ48396.1 outer membrane usher protein PapC [Xenorhabdus mauleonii]